MSEFDDFNNQNGSQENNNEAPTGQPEETKADYTPEVNAQPQQPEQPQQAAPTENKNPYSAGNQQYYGGYNQANGTQYYGSRQGGYTPQYQQRPPQTPSYTYQEPKRTNYVYYGSGSQQAFQPQAPVQPHQPRTSKGAKTGRKIFFSIIAVLAVIALLVTGIAIGRGGKGNSAKKGNINDAPVLEVPTENKDAEKTDTDDGSQLKYSTSSDELDPRDIYHKVKDASVGVLINYNGLNRSSSGEGSGVIVGEDASGKYTYIITCAHVVSDGGTISVQLSDDSQYEATLVGSDARTDIAVLRISKTGLTAIEIGDSENLEVGETVYAIGNPGGVDFAGSFTNGMISAIARPISSEIGYQMVCIQHTAAINPGNSGGALVNAKGQLIGINSSKIASTDYEGMGFSVPSSTFVKVYNEIIKHGYVTNRPKLGIRYAPAMSNQTYAMLVSANNLPTGSLIIVTIDTDGALANTQVQEGDMIIAVNGKELESADYLPDLIEGSKVGDKLTLTVCRFDNNYKMNQFDVEVTLVEDKGTTSSTPETTTQSQQYYFYPFEFFGYGNGNGN